MSSEREKILNWLRVGSRMLSQFEDDQWELSSSSMSENSPGIISPAFDLRQRPRIRFSFFEEKEKIKDWLRICDQMKNQVEGVTSNRRESNDSSLSSESWQDDLSIEEEDVVENFDYSSLPRPKPRRKLKGLSCQEAIDDYLDEKFVSARKFKYIW